MKKIAIFLIVLSMLCFSITGAGISVFNENEEQLNENSQYELNEIEEKTFNNLKKTAQKFKVFSNKDFKPYNELQGKEISIPWVDTDVGDLLEWYVRLKYNGKEFLKKVDITIFDFQEQFLKHPLYGKHIRFNVDNDMYDDIEVIIGFYWANLRKPNGPIVKSLETRFQVMQLYADDGSNNYGLADSDAEFEVWSEIHVNWGLVQENSKTKDISENGFISKFNTFLERFNLKNSRIYQLIQNFFLSLKNRFNNHLIQSNNEPILTPSDSDYFSIGTGYRSPEGEEVPRHSEKKFAFAKESLFSPTVFQQIMDPGSVVGDDPIELLFGFQSYKADTDTKQYDIEFSVEFEPAVYLKTKFVPIDGLVYYFFRNSQSSQTKITFGTNILKGAGEDTTVSLVLDRITSNLARDTSWMMFDIDLIDFEPLGGAFSYEASDKFDVSMIVNAPTFYEKVKVNEVPTSADLSWDVDFGFEGSSFIEADVSGYADLSMNSDLGGIEVFYPKENENDQDKIFLKVDDIPSSKASASAGFDLNINNFLDQDNMIYANLDHTASSRLGTFEVYLIENDYVEVPDGPIFDIANAPSKAEGKIELFWNIPKGRAYGYTNGGSTMNLDIGFSDFQITNNLQLRNGHLDTRFKVANDGYFGLDTSNNMLENTLTVNKGESDSFSLSIGNVDADNFFAHWDFSGGTINDIGFEGLVDRLEGLVLNIDYKGKVADMNLDWVLGRNGYFDIGFDQNSDVSIDFSDFAPESDVYYLDGGITISNDINFDMNWDFKQGEDDGSGNVDPGHFTVNQYTDTCNIKSFDFIFTYNSKYGVEINLDNLVFYLDFEWWKGDKLLPYVWLDYEVSHTNFDVHLLWTNRNGETQWHRNVENW